MDKDRYPQTKDIKTLEDVLEDIDKKMIFTIFDKTKTPDINETIFGTAHKMGRMQQYFKVIANALIELKKKL